MTTVAECLSTSRPTIRTDFVPGVHHNIQFKISISPHPPGLLVCHTVLVVRRVTAVSMVLGEVLGSNSLADVERVKSLNIRLGLLSSN